MAKEDAQGTVFLTNDLTTVVVDEAIREGASIIVCYRKFCLFSVIDLAST